MIIYIIASILTFFASALLINFFSTKKIGLLLFALILFGSSILAINLDEWWPFLMAFGLGWVLRLLGLDPNS